MIPEEKAALIVWRIMVPTVPFEGFERHLLKQRRPEWNQAVRLIADEMREYAEAVTNFSVASNRTWTGQDGEKHEQVVWYRVSAWNRLAEICNQYLSKGRQVYVEGELRLDESGGPRVFMRNDGMPGASFEVTARTVQFLGGRNGGSDAPDVPEEQEEAPF
jgi:single-strand DNA-binding protein